MPVRLPLVLFVVAAAIALLAAAAYAQPQVDIEYIGPNDLDFPGMIEGSIPVGHDDYAAMRLDCSLSGEPEGLLLTSVTYAVQTDGAISASWDAFRLTIDGIEVGAHEPNAATMQFLLVPPIAIANDTRILIDLRGDVSADLDPGLPLRSIFTVTELRFQEMDGDESIMNPNINGGTFYPSNGPVIAVAPNGPNDETLVESASTNAQLAAFSVDAPAGIFNNLDSVELRMIGDADPATDCPIVKLALDSNGDGLFDDASDPVIASDAWSANDDVILLPLLAGDPIPTGDGPITLLVLVDTSASVTEGDELGVLVVNVEVGGVGMQTGVTFGGPVHEFGTPTPTVAGVSLADTGNSEAQPGDLHRIAPIVVTASGAAIVLDRLTIVGGGSGDEAVGIAQVLLLRDATGDGMVNGIGEEGGDEVLDTGTFTVDDGTLDLDVRLALPGGGQVTLLLAYQFHEVVTPGSTWRATITALDCDADMITGLPLASGLTNIALDEGGPGGDDDDGPDLPDDPGGDFDFGGTGIGSTNCAAGSTSNWAGPAPLLLAITMLLAWRIRRSG